MSGSLNKLDQVLVKYQEVAKDDTPVRVFQLISGRLKSPRIITCSEEDIRCDKYDNSEVVYVSDGFGGE